MEAEDGDDMVIAHCTSARGSREEGIYRNIKPGTLYHHKAHDRKDILFPLVTWELLLTRALKCWGDKGEHDAGHEAGHGDETVGAALRGGRFRREASDGGPDASN